MKNLLDPNVKEEIFQRIEKLSPNAKSSWGKMNVNQGLRHMKDALLIPVGDLNPTLVNPPKMPKWLLKFFLLNMKPPKEAAETFKEINMVANNISIAISPLLHNIVTVLMCNSRFSGSRNPVVITHNQLIGK